jgi:hypothetical protein
VADLLVESFGETGTNQQNRAPPPESYQARESLIT